MADESTHVSPIEREARAVRDEARVVFLVVLVVGLAAYILSGLVTIGENEMGLLIRLGRINKTIKPGPYLAFPWPIDQVVKIPTKQIQSIRLNDFNTSPAELAELKRYMMKKYRGTDRGVWDAMLDPYLVSGDKNVLHIDLTVRYLITDPEAWYLSVAQPAEAGKFLLIDSLIRSVSPKPVMYLMTRGQNHVRSDVFRNGQAACDRMKLGVTLQSVELNTVRPPRPVQDAFNELFQALSKNKTMLEEAQSYRNEQLADADAEARKTILEAKAYADKRVNLANGEVRWFRDLLAEYRKHPKLVKLRLYLDTVGELGPSLASSIIRIHPGRPGDRMVITIPTDQEENAETQKR